MTNEQTSRISQPTMSRRSLLKTAVSAFPAAAILTHSRSAFAAEQTVIVRTTSGGSYGEAMEKAIFAPFTKATGITVQKTPSDMAPLIASAKAGRPIVDVVDTSEGLLQTLASNGALADIEYDRFKFFTVDDIGQDAAQAKIIRRMVYARVLGYKKSLFPNGGPTSWAEFWDVKKFPATRALSGLALNYPDLEFGLMAQGVALADIYPVDIKKALDSFSSVRQHIHTFYGTDAISQSLLSTGEVELEAIANGRIQPMIDEGGDYAIEWNQHMKIPSGYSILNGAKNMESAHKFIDFAMSPEVQAHFATLIPYGPVNKKAFASIPEEFAIKLPTNPKWTDKGFVQNAKWWGDNLADVTKAWNEWAAN